MDIAEVLAPVRDLGGFIRQQREAAQISLRQLARQAGVSNPYLSQVERGLRRPSAEILAQIAHGLQISVESLLTMAGILEDPAGSPHRVGVPAAISADPMLTERQKASLLDIYQLYRRETERAGAVPPEATPQPDFAAAGASVDPTPTAPTPPAGTPAERPVPHPVPDPGTL